MEIREGQELPQGNSGDSSASAEESVVYRIEVFREDDGRYAAEWTTGDGKIAGIGNYAASPVGALAELCATLIKCDEDNAIERASIVTGAESQPVAVAVDPAAEAQD